MHITAVVLEAPKCVPAFLDPYQNLDWVYPHPRDDLMSIKDDESKGICILSLGTPFIQTQGVGATELSDCTDNGGPGTYSQLIILKDYMSRLANDLGVDEEDVYPADHFDLMGGVGFGGWVFLSFNL